MKKQFLGTMFLTIAGLTACGGAANTTNTANTATNSTSTTNMTGTAPTTPVTTTKSGDESLSDPKGSIAYQFDLIKAGEADKLSACCFTDRARSGVTKEVVDKAKGDASKYTMEDLVDSVEMGENDGRKTAKIKMKNGRTLTTLIETNGKWLADTVWFK